ncbi:AraC family transcriptional regulator [Noviherbaspirillum pedocola]|uniref:AraC family transcriptional regulator n=1 Tax=Noviherbaspirillum pedocola TaxID=2801341 RepID=A0A934T0E3_9BURK|nr:AraC family transcriptional regulator [Noviherbaspirillum pedocola]MBK4739233.1 AraC family transcriptional regulator [Noviherbaspirillum pedocola]
MISSLFPRFSFSAETFFTGEFCGSNVLNATQNVGHLHLVRRGPVTMEHEDGSSITATEPTIIFYPRPYTHRVVVRSGTQAELVCANVLFKEAPSNPFALALPSYFAIPLREAQDIGAVVDLLYAEAFTAPRRNPFPVARSQRFVMDRLCDVLVFQLIRYAVNASIVQAGVLAGFTDNGIARALNAIHEDPAHNWNLEKLASLASMSRSKFAERFHSLVGITPAKYVADWRLGMAEQLLRQNISVKKAPDQDSVELRS